MEGSGRHPPVEVFCHEYPKAPYLVDHFEKKHTRRLDEVYVVVRLHRCNN